jgi:hypothetical protein
MWETLIACLGCLLVWAWRLLMCSVAACYWSAMAAP